MLKDYIQLALVAGSALTLTVSCGQREVSWETNYDAALQQAKARGSFVLVDFTGSDWCPYCIQLKQNVLSTKAFEEYAAKNKLVLLELDFLRTPGQLTQERAQELERVRELYQVNGFPTVILLDGDGYEFARFVGSAPNPEVYIEGLQKALAAKRAYDKALAGTAKLSGEQKAAALMAALECLPEECRLSQKEVVAEIISLDPEDKYGYKRITEEKALFEAQKKEIMEMMARFRSKVDESDVKSACADALEMLKREDWLPTMRLMLNKYVSDCYALLKDLPQAMTYLKAAIDSAPDSPEAETLRAWLDHLEKNIAKPVAEDPH